MGFNLDDYEPVSARIAKFYADHPKGRIATALVEVRDMPQGEWVVGAAIYREGDDKPWATGLAHETPEGHVNKTSALENCETSAVGRALANAGYAGTDPEKRASREEMSKVQRSGEPRGGGSGGGTASPATTSGDANDPFKDVLLNPDGWFDNRFDKKSPKAPDFKAKNGNKPWGTAGEYRGQPAPMALWLSDAPPGFHEALEAGDPTLCYPNPPAARGKTVAEANEKLAAQDEEFSSEPF